MADAGSGAVGIVMFAHGARDPRWAEPFLRIAEQVRAAAPGTPVELAYLDFMTPDLRGAIHRLVACGVERIRVVPLFFGPGGHLRTDVPNLIAEETAAHPRLVIELAPAAGEDPGVVAAIAAYCVRNGG
jgi:sirohydrochlorin cobaltochelatase